MAFVTFGMAVLVLLWFKQSSLREVYWGEEKLYPVCEEFRFEIESNYVHPVLYLQVHDQGGQSKFVLLSDGEGQTMKSFHVISTTRLASGKWKNKYRLRYYPQVVGLHTLSVRLEYTSLPESLRDYPVNSSSFIGETVYRESRNFKESQVGKWLGDLHYYRKHPDGYWAWPGYATCKPSAEVLGKFGKIYIYGDSQPQFMCKFIRSRYPDLPVAKCAGARGVLKDVLEQITKFITNHTGPLVINPCGLWETAYGNMTTLFRPALRKFLQALLASRHNPVFIMTTTSVHPIHYKTLGKDRRKWAMTQPRAELTNEIIREELLGVDGSKKKIRLLDTGMLSYSGDDDPASATDMRHFGKRTNNGLGDYLLCELQRIFSEVGH
eukprot:CAMPEP_0203796798 /NCGR_PEP_ID=MMETSP0100_2-20121128/8194_1 /ASSEMBLY_ACC=CAM_ASM_000210 /TAXON_ID=96639 /ORGANISM=" , Strain NY0313808BC1" /LENGTH=379 /DNA_ID=CAMNT_0050701875 /DNA_START=346 /DNA_END=1485 /DNA_ORIENTATION=+